MKYTAGMSVFGNDGQKIGRVKHVVIQPETREVTHLVIERGFLFTEEKLLPIRWVERTEESGVILSADKTDFDDLPSYIDTHYIAAEDVENASIDAVMVEEPAYYYYGVPGYLPAYYPTAMIGNVEPYYAVAEQENIPENTVALKIGAAVISRDGETVGNLDEVFTTPHDHVTHFVLSQGLLFTTRKIIPTQWIGRVETDKVHLRVSADYLQGVPDYEGVNT